MVEVVQVVVEEVEVWWCICGGVVVYLWRWWWRWKCGGSVGGVMLVEECGGGVVVEVLVVLWWCGGGDVVEVLVEVEEMIMEHRVREQLQAATVQDLSSDKGKVGGGSGG